MTTPYSVDSWLLGHSFFVGQLQSE